MLQIKDLWYSIGDRDLLQGVEWIINPGRKMALIGANGVGKTTLLRILTGQITPDRGTINRPKQYRIGYLPQEELAVGRGTVLQEAMRGREDLLSMERKIEQLQGQLAGNGDKQDQRLKQLGDFQQQYEAAGGWLLAEDAKRILFGLGFTESDCQRPLPEMSGGWKMRAYLARLLLQQPDLLLLDEPTNHLDLPSLEWLEQYLLTFANSIVLVSHDRFFIDRLSEEIYELEAGILTFYAGNYHFFEQKKAADREQLLQKRDHQLKIRRQQEAFINRFRAKNTKAKQVQSRIKQLDKMEIIDVPQTSAGLDFSIPLPETSFKHVLHMEDVAFKYDSTWIFQHLNLDIYRGQKIALVGINGAGKTTLTRIINKQLSPQLGKVVLGERTKLGYYAQHQVEALDLEATVYNEVAATAHRQNIPKIRDFLGIFQLRGDDVFKRVSVLSGGEKARVSLTKMLLSPVNFLIMDEPTNHLDPQSKEALEKALLEYEGTLLLISHDRYFLDKITHKVIELKNGQVEEFLGNYSYYLEKRVKNGQFLAKSAEISKETRDIKKERKEQRRVQAQIRQELSKDRNRLTGEIEILEEAIDRLEQEKGAIEQQMAVKETYNDSQLVVQLQKEQSRITRKLNQALQDWERANKELDGILNRLKF